MTKSEREEIRQLTTRSIYGLPGEVVIRELLTHADQMDERVEELEKELRFYGACKSYIANNKGLIPVLVDDGFRANGILTKTE